MRELLALGDMVHTHLDWLDADIVKHTDEAMARYADARYADAAISAGKALEGLCRQRFCCDSGVQTKRVARLAL